MGSVSLKIGEGTARFRRSPSWLSFPLSLLMLLSVLATNLLALYAFTRSPPPPQHPTSANTNTDGSGNLSVISDHLSLILREISTSQRTLSVLERDLLGYDSPDPFLDPSSPSELRLFLSSLPLPLGPDSKSHLSHMTSSVSHLCSKSLHPFMSYSPYHLCPSAPSLPLQLLSRRCDPLPRRRCLSPRAVRHLLPFPSSLWSGPGDSFDKLMWIKSRGKNDFLADEVLDLARARGPARIGLDLTPGAGNFAARMAERNVTVISLTVDGKMSEIISSRGLLPLQITAAQRFPFYDGVFDLVHTMELDDGGGGMEGMEFLMFDVDRVLRVGGLFWLDNYWCVDEKRKAAVTALIERFGYRKLKWVVGEKADTAGGTGKPKVYLSAVLQKPTRG